MVLQVSGQYSGAIFMADQNKGHVADENESSNAFPVTGGKPHANRQAPRLLPPWKVLLHNDNVSHMDHVVETIHQLTPLNREQAIARMREAHEHGCSLLLITHLERAELYVEQFRSCRLTVSIEPAT